MPKENIAAIDKRILKTFGAAFFLIILIIFSFTVFAFDGCKDSIMSSDDIPCLLLLPFNESVLNCSVYSVSIYKGETFLYSNNLSNFSNNFMCSAINTQTAKGTYTAHYSTGDTADWVVEGGTKMIWILYLAVAFFMALFLIALWQKDANLGAISGMGFFCTGLFVFLLVKGTVVVSGFTLESNMLTETLAIIILGFGMFIMGSAWEEWFQILG